VHSIKPLLENLNTSLHCTGEARLDKCFYEIFKDTSVERKATFNNLKAEFKSRLQADLLKSINKTVSVFLKLFNQGKTLRLCKDQTSELCFDLQEISATAFRGVTLQEALQSKKMIAFNGTRLSAVTSRWRKESMQRGEEYIKRLEILAECLQFEFYLSAKLNTPLNSLTDAERNDKTHIEGFKSFKKKRAVLELDALCENIGLEKRSRIKKKTGLRQKAKEASQILSEDQENTSPVNKAVQIIKPSLFIEENCFALHKRITRWNTCTIGAVKKFKDLRDGKRITSYAQLPDEAIQTQIIHHKLPGIDKILSIKNITNYSFNYEFEGHKGKGFNAQLKRKDHPIENGVIYVAFDEDNIIYHAKFVPIKDVVQFNILGLCPIPKTEVYVKDDFQSAGKYSLEFIQDDILWRTSKETTYTLSPLC
jgi:hypothetical protein